MQDDRRNLGIPYIIRKALLLAAFFFLAGCSRRDTEEYGIEELQLTEKTRQEDVKAGTKQTEETDAAGDDEIRKSAETSGETTVFVYVCGAVKEPGVYELDADARVYERYSLPEVLRNRRRRILSIRQGRHRRRTDLCSDRGRSCTGRRGWRKYSNQKCGEHKSKYKYSWRRGTHEPDRDRRSKAASILKYRDEHGRFESIEELMQIEGIKEGVFNKIKDDITI